MDQWQPAHHDRRRRTPRRRSTEAILVAVVVALSLGALWLVSLVLDGGGAATSGPAGALVVDEVVDGDTIVVRAGATTETVRLLGIDTPETKHPTKPVECYGHEASARTAELLAPGTAVRLERDVEERDVYDRLLAYVYRADDGLFVNLALAADGYADTLSIEPNVAHAADLSAAVAAARRESRGLWGACGGPDVPVASP